ncbi:MAG: polysaccharide biosynthesis/export family protein [Planctomycetota bacterium]
MGKCSVACQRCALGEIRVSCTVRRFGGQPNSLRSTDGDGVHLIVGRCSRHLENRIIRSIPALILMLAVATSITPVCHADEPAKQNALHKAAQEWIQVGTEQHQRSLFKAAEKSFRRAAVFRSYLTDAERQNLDELLEKSAGAALARELTSVSTPASDKLAPPVQQVDASKVVALDTKAVEVKPPAKIVETKADSIKDGKHLSRKEWAYIKEEPMTATSSFGKQVKLAPKPASPPKTAESAQAAPGPRVVFEPGDVIEVKFFYTPQLDTTQTVRPDGKISLQLIPEVKAQGKTVAELRSELMKLYDPHLKAPEISVVARSFYNQRVFVGGQVLKAGVVQMPGKMTAFEAIMEVGGFDLRAAERKSVIVIRYSKGRRYAYKLDLKQATAGKESKPFYLQPKDIVHVPRTKIAKLNQWIDQHINKIIPDTGFYLRRTNGDTTYGMGNYR